MRVFRIPALGAVSMLCMTLLPGCGEKPPGEELLVHLGKQGTVLMHFQDLVEGNGEPVKKFDKIEVHYTGWLQNGKVFDTSREKNEPFPLVVSMGQVIKGWDEGIIGMKVGGKRKLYIPSRLAYGEVGFPPDSPAAAKIIPPNASLIFEIELLRIFPPSTPPPALKKK
jgi:FKBP-type peptidyl-prolyl cis-trans isomerase